MVAHICSAKLLRQTKTHVPARAHNNVQAHLPQIDTDTFVMFKFICKRPEKCLIKIVKKKVCI